jgi:hypothetical protein
MKHLNNFEEFNESKLTPYIVGAALTGATLMGVDSIINPTTKATAKYQETELAHFPEFYVRTLGMDNNLNVSVNENDGVIGCQTKQGKHSNYTITIEEGTNIVYYKISSFGEYIYATTNESNLPGGSIINLSELEVVEETGEYRILKVPSFWSSLDFILVNKGYSNAKNEFEMNGVKYTYFEKSFSFLGGRGSFVVKVR